MNSSRLTSEQGSSLLRAAKAASESSDVEHAWTIIQPLLVAQREQRDVAMSLLSFLGERIFSPDRNLEAFELIEAAHPADDELICWMGESFDLTVEIDFLNAPAPDSKLGPRLISSLAKIGREDRGTKAEIFSLGALSSVSRLSGLRFNDISEAAYRRLVEIDPNISRHHYNLGLFLKTRGRFEEGMLANRRARELSANAVESYEWNFGICATGAGAGEAALEVWKRMGQKLEMGRFGLPEGRYQSCKVRLAENPLAERTAEFDEPGVEETVWIERLSPCHGIIRSVLYQSLGVDYGDVVLFDGAPITYHKYGDENVAVFPHLATLRRQKYKFFDFMGTQSAGRQIADLTKKLRSDSVIYSHSESYETLCMDCWRDANTDHAHTQREELNVVRGRIAVGPDQDEGVLLDEIDAVIPIDNSCRIFSPALCEAAGRHDRAKFERRRFDQLASS